MDKNKINRRDFLAGAVTLAAVAGCRSAKEKFPVSEDCTRYHYDAEKIRFNAKGEFRFLQLTDVHLKSCEGKLPEETDLLLRQAFAKYKPALVVLTGDIVWCKLTTAKGNFEKALKPLVDIFIEHKVCFCVTFGNHDSEYHGPDWYTRQEMYDFYKKFGGEYFVDHDVPELTGCGNGVVEVCLDGSSKPQFNLFVMDSGAYAKDGGYDACRTDQIAWYEKVSGSTPALWFQHIIVPDVNVTGLFVDAPRVTGKSDAAEKTAKGETQEPKIKEGPDTGYRMSWPDGGRMMLLAPGVKGDLMEHTCPPRWITYRNEAHTYQGRTLYDSWRKMGNIKGAYFGHDHTNSFDGVDKNGIRFGMTKTASFTTYNDGTAGLRAFTLHADGTYDTETFFVKPPFKKSSK
ncbi:MAG: metallophosphoesterase [Kiritimatiellae bacterium]|nr:metallophosphoesterase [Kiritimatiellia bacterium]